MKRLLLLLGFLVLPLCAFAQGTPPGGYSSSGGGGGGGGGVTSFSGDGTLLSNSGSTGAVTDTVANAAAHKWFGNSSGSTGAPGYNSIGSGDLPGSGTTTINGVSCTIGSSCSIPTNFGATTVIVTGGAGGLSGTSGFGTTGNTRYFVTANDTESAALAITANFVTVECAPGVVIQFTGATGGFNVSGSNDTIQQPCVLDHNSQSGSGTGPLIKASGNDGRFEGLVFQNTGTTNPASSTVLITGGSRNKVLKNTFAGTQADSCIGLVPTTEAFDTFIQDNVIPTFNPGTASLNCLNVAFNSGSASTSQVRTSLIHNTIVGQGSNADLILYQDQNIAIVATSQNPHIEQNTLTATGGLNEMLKTFAFRSGTENFNILNDGGNAFLTMMHQGDFYNSSVIGNVLNGTSASGSGGINCTDCSGNTYHANTLKGIGNGQTGMFIGTASNPSLHNKLTGNDVTLSGAGICYQLQANDSTGPTSDNNSSGNGCHGTGAASEFCWEVVDTSGGTVGNSSNGDTCDNVTNGFVVSAGAVGTRIINPTFDTVTAANAYALSATTTVVDMNGVLFANIPSNLANGSMLYVSDSTIANPCASGGSGAILKQLNAVHVCN